MIEAIPIPRMTGARTATTLIDTGRRPNRAHASAARKTAEARPKSGSALAAGTDASSLVRRSPDSENSEPQHEVMMSGRIPRKYWIWSTRSATAIGRQGDAADRTSTAPPG